MPKFFLLTAGALFVALLFAALPGTALCAGGVTRVKADITSDSVWSGEVLVEGPVSVKKGATLKVMPGAKIRFARGAGLSVEGVLLSEGAEKSRIAFVPDAKNPEPGCWSGINFSQTGKAGSVMSYSRIEYAEAVRVVSGSPEIKNCELAHGVMGFALQSRKSTPKLRHNRITGMSAGGVQCQMGAAPEITGNTLERCGPFGVSTAQESMPVITGNTISECGAGILLSQLAPPVEDNVLKKNKAGIVATMAGKDVSLRGNRVVENEVGIICRQFSNPLVEKNEVSGNKQGIVCFMASSPMIRHNSVSGNEEGISCIQICNPMITLNDVHGNGKGIYLDLSSYAVINENNIYGNEMQIELGNMSSDWEHRVNNKPVRGGQAQNLTMAQRGKAVAQPIGDDASIMGYVDATGNWWGEPVTKEMAHKGPDADIESLKDYFDVPVLTYEGYEGEYVQDRIRYEGWKSSRIKDAGI